MSLDYTSLPQNAVADALAAGLEAFRRSDERYRIAAEISSEIIMEYHPMEDYVFFVSTRMEQLYGVPSEVESGRDYLLRTGVVQPESEYDFLMMFQRIREGEPRVQSTVKMRTSEGELRWNQIVCSTLYDEQGYPERAVCVIKDITQQKEVELQYESELLYRSAMCQDAMLSYELDLTNRKVISGLENLFSESDTSFSDDYDLALSRLIEQFVFPEDHSILYEASRTEHLIAEFARGNTKIEIEYRRLNSENEPFWVRCTAYLTGNQQTGAILAFCYVHNIHEEKIEDLRLREKAERDPLTNLYNKAMTEQLIRLAISIPPMENAVSAFLIIDLDNFKQVNDQLGHAFGDAVLSETASKLRALCRHEDIAGRIGGDEFVLFLKNLPNFATVQRRAQRICETFHSAFSGTFDEHKISGSVGVALFPQHGTTFDELYRKADLALYAAKNQGKDSFSVYSSEIKDVDEETIHHAEIDSNESQLFSENVTEYVFRILYEAKDLERAVSGILALVAKHFGFSRGYLYEQVDDGSSFTCTFDWCEPGQISLREGLPLLNSHVTALCLRRFAEDNLYLMNSPEEMEPEERDVPIIAAVHSRMQYALRNGNQLHGFLGFDRNGGTPLELCRLAPLRSVAQMLSVFLLERYASAQQEKTRSMLQTVADSINTCTYMVDPRTHLLQFVNRNTSNIIPHALPGTLCYQTLRGRMVPCDDCPLPIMLEQNLRNYRTEMYMDPYHLWAKIDAALVTLSDGEEYGLFTSYDLTPHATIPDAPIIVDESFTQNTPLYRALCRSTDDYIFVCDMTKNLFYLPQSMVDEFNLPGQVVENLTSLWSERIHPNERQAFLHEMSELASGRLCVHSQEYRAQNHAGRWVWLRCRGYVELDIQGTPVLFVGIITFLEKKGIIDYLSGLPNKYEFERRMREALRAKSGGWMLLLGLDNFKNINSLYGWDFGDRIIREAAQNMQLLIPEHLQLYRLDGDKFGLYCLSGAALSPEIIYATIYESFQAQQQFDGIRYYCTISGGYASFDNDSTSFTRLFRQAEFALDYSKSEGKNRINGYSDELMGNKSRMLTIIEGLRESAYRGCSDFALHYQPQVNAHTREVVAAEALLRWRCAEYGNVRPDEFIPLLEQTGLIHSIGRWVILQAAAASKSWRQHYPEMTVSVNLSYIQLQDKSFLPFLRQLIEGGELDPHGIHLELTESCIAAGGSTLLQSFADLRNLGFCIEMDDFGTGYSSLSILKTAPTDVVKIDRAFVVDIAYSKFDATFIQFIVSLCHSVGIKVCLEGVETWEEYRLVEAMELDFIQGYLFGKPQPRGEFEANFLNL